MSDGRVIRRSLYIDATPSDVADALTRVERIRRWWTREAFVRDGVGLFGWSASGWTIELEMKREANPLRIVWECVRSNMHGTSAWMGTLIVFDLIAEGDGTRLNFSQLGYRESSCFEVSEQGWEFFLDRSLTRYLETGIGMPYPDTEGGVFV